MCPYLGINKRVWTECSGCKKPLCPAHFNGNHKEEKWSHDSMSAASKTPSAVGGRALEAAAWCHLGCVVLLKRSTMWLFFYF